MLCAFILEEEKSTHPSRLVKLMHADEEPMAANAPFAIAFSGRSRTASAHWRTKLVARFLAFNQVHESNQGPPGLPLGRRNVCILLFFVAVRPRYASASYPVIY
ncbi:hypothetical protein CPB83DRAFT_288686 [Crepidotus variabilis]|uniref:Uncharacterized protein n=1 Tax=Crepidotus variabilis TaxID=179855 RepID=A0A9P6EH16_9AGAR|nr:hypothetical protein CPB83DRAFT_288686 [Crepidotus variabilis]